MKLLAIAVLPAALLISLPVAAQSQKSISEPGAASLLKADHVTAEKEIRNANLSKYDPARAINLGVALALKGDKEKAAEQFRRALFADEVDVVVADGQQESSHDVARRALAALQNGQLGR